MLNKLKLYIGLLVIPMLLLQGCGGPSDDVSSEENSGSASVSVEGLSFSVTDSVYEEATNSIPSTDYAIVNILLDTSSGSSANRLVDVSSTVGTVSQSQVLTDGNGRASFLILPPESLISGSATGTITVSSETGETASLNFEFIASSQLEGEGGSIQFIGTSTNIISLKGIGGIGYGETSTVTFKVVDTDGNAVEGVQVNFELSSELGGLALSKDSAVSDTNGEVTTTVNSGTVAGSVVVKANLANDANKNTLSSNLTITTGIPDQNSFSLTAVDLAPDGAWIRDGVTTQLNVRLADQFNNPVPDGTSVYFTTEGGRIDGSCQTISSACSVTWESQDYRPNDHRVTILAYAVGHETFYDSNSNGLFDEGELFDDLPNAFRDDDENGRYSQTASGSLSKDEKYFDYDQTGSFTGDLDGDVIRDGVFTGLDEDNDGQPNGNGQYNGVTCDNDSCTSSLTYVFDNITLVMPDDDPVVHLYQVIDVGNFLTCLDSNGKIDSDKCVNVSGGSLTLTSTSTFWTMIEDTAVLCEDSSGARFALPTSRDFEYDSCSSVIHSSTATNSSIDVDNGGIGDLLDEVSETPNTNTFTAFLFRIKPDPENTEDDEGILKVEVTTDRGFGSSSVDVVDPADVVIP